MPLLETREPRRHDDQPAIVTDTLRALWLCGLPAPRDYPPHTELFRQHSDLRDVFFIEQGLVKLAHTSHDGRERILSLRFRASFIGAALVIARQRTPVSAVTVGRCMLCQISRDDFLRALRSEPSLSWAILQTQSLEICNQYHRLAELSAVPSRLRLEHFLRRAVAQTEGTARRGEIRLNLPLKRGELAQLLSVTPEHLSRLFRQLQDEGLIRLSKGWIFVPEASRLKSAEQSLAW